MRFILWNGVAGYSYETWVGACVTLTGAWPANLGTMQDTHYLTHLDVEDGEVDEKRGSSAVRELMLVFCCGFVKRTMDTVKCSAPCNG